MKFHFIAASLALIGSAIFVNAAQPDYPFYRPNQQPQANYILKEGEHELRGKSGDGIIEFENGAQFKAVSDPERVMTWNFYDHITIIPNPYPFRHAPYYAVNIDKKGDYVCVDYWRSPGKSNPATDFLWRIDRASQEIILMSNTKVKTRWKVDEDDFRELCQHWKHGDSVIVGKNEGWFTCWSEHKFILISYRASNHNAYIRATPKPL